MLELDANDFTLEVRLKAPDGAVSEVKIDVLTFNDHFANETAAVDWAALKGNAPGIFGVYQSAVASYLGVPAESLPPGMAFRLAQEAFRKRDAVKKADGDAGRPT